jgi:hypothetical protein
LITTQQIYKVAKQLFYVKTWKSFVAITAVVLNLAVGLISGINGTFSSVIAGIFLAVFVDEQIFVPLRIEYLKTVDDLMLKYMGAIRSQQEQLDEIQEKLNDR